MFAGAWLSGWLAEISAEVAGSGTALGALRDDALYKSTYFTFYFYHRNPHDILYNVAKRHPYRTTKCRNMMSYIFLKMAAATAKYYLRFRIC